MFRHLDFGDFSTPCSWKCFPVFSDFSHFWFSGEQRFMTSSIFSLFSPNSISLDAQDFLGCHGNGPPHLARFLCGFACFFMLLLCILFFKGEHLNTCNKNTGTCTTSSNEFYARWFWIEHVINITRHKLTHECSLFQISRRGVQGRGGG